MSLKEKIFALKDSKVEPVHVPEWDMTIHVRSLTGHERNKVYEALTVCEKTNRMSDLSIHLVILGVCDEDGKPLFDAGDFGELSKRCGVALDRIARVVSRVNGLNPGALDEKKVILETIPV